MSMLRGMVYNSISFINLLRSILIPGTGCVSHYLIQLDSDFKISSLSYNCGVSE